MLVLFFTGLGLFGAITIGQVKFIPLTALLISGFGLGWISNAEIER